MEREKEGEALEIEHATRLCMLPAASAPLLPRHEPPPVGNGLQGVVGGNGGAGVWGRSPLPRRLSLASNNVRPRDNVRSAKKVGGS